MKAVYLNEEKVREVPDDGILYAEVEELEHEPMPGVIGDDRFDRFVKFVSLAFVVERVVNKLS